MCVPVAPSVGGATTKAAGTPPVAANTAPLPVGIDYSKYANKSPYEIQTQMHPGGLPQGWSWDNWMQANAGAPDPRNHTNSGELITPAQLAQWGPSHAPATTGNPVNRPASGPVFTPGAAPTTPQTTNPVSRPPVVASAPAAPQVVNPVSRAPLPSNSAPEPSGAHVPSTPEPANLGPGSALFFGNAPVSNHQGTYRVDPAYSPGETQLGDPVTRVSHAMSRRYRPRVMY